MGMGKAGGIQMQEGRSMINAAQQGLSLHIHTAFEGME